MAEAPIGSEATITLLRNGQQQDIAVKLGELPEQLAGGRPAEADQESWGMTVANITPGIARRFQLDANRRGVVVTAVAPGSPAAAAGIQPGDLIEEVNRKPVTSVSEFSAAIAEQKDTDPLLILARRGTFTSFFALEKSG